MNKQFDRAHRKLPMPSPWKTATMLCAAGLVAAAMGTSAWAVDASRAGPPVVNNGEPSADDANAPLLPDRPDLADATGDALGSVYTNHTAGISLRVPAGSKKVMDISPDLLAEFDVPARHWELKIAMVVRDKPTKLTTRQDLINPGVAFATTNPATLPAPTAKVEDGLMEKTIKELKRSLPAAKVLREDLTSLPNGDQTLENNVGLLAVRYTAAAQRRLAQQALIEASDRVFYVLTLTSPGKDNDNSPGDDPREMQAVDTFRQIIDSVDLLDRATVRREQEERLYCTRALFVNFSPARLKAAMIPEQWLRQISDGKDVGYSYICEQPAGDIPRLGQKPVAPETVKGLHVDVKGPQVPPGPNILIGIRSRTITDGIRTDKTRGPIITDNESWLFTSLDRNHEEWSREILVDDRLPGPDGKPKKPQFMEELGDSNKRLKEVMLPVPDGAPIGTKPDMVTKVDYRLDVELVNSGAAMDPISRQLSPFYVSQAIGHLLPRLLPLHEPKGYLFAQYVNEAREVMMRYMDVQPQQPVNIMGKTVFAIPIDDRIGLDGSITTHYFSPTGKYLGSENKDRDLWIVPSDSETIESIWQNNALLVVPDAAHTPHSEADAR